MTRVGCFFDFTGVFRTGIIKLPFLRGVKQCKSVVILRDCSANSFGVFWHPWKLPWNIQVFPWFPGVFKTHRMPLYKMNKKWHAPLKSKRLVDLKIAVFLAKERTNMKVNHPSTSNFGFKMWIFCWYLYIFFCGRGIGYTLLGRITYPHISPTVVSGGWLLSRWFVFTTSPGKNRPSRSKKKEGKETKNSSPKAIHVQVLLPWSLT